MNRLPVPVDSGENADCSSRPQTRRPCSRRPQRLIGCAVPRNACGNPAALSPRMNGKSIAGPQNWFAVDTPTATPHASTRSVDCPGSTISYGRSPNRCGRSITEK